MFGRRVGLGEALFYKLIFMDEANPFSIRGIMLAFKKIDDAEGVVPDPHLPPETYGLGGYLARKNTEEMSDADKRRAEFYEDVGDPLAAVRNRFSNARPMKKVEVEESIGKVTTEYEDGFEKDFDEIQVKRDKKLENFPRRG